MDILAQRFELSSKLGHGGLATVYLAKDRLDGRQVAIKIIHEHLADDPVIRERFARELAITRQAKHPGIVEQFEFHQTGDKCFISMEYMAGGDLRSRLNRLGRLPIRPAIKMSLEILEALGNAHSKGIIHRDIKPHNILFTADDKAKLSDFGLARGAGGEGIASSTVNAGTPEYSPPELVLGHLTDARSDIYSFGITLYETICGRLPFTGNSPLEILYAQANTSPPDPRQFNSELPDSLADIIVKALAKNPLDRYQSAADFASALSGLITPFLRTDVNTADSLANPDNARQHCTACGRTIDALGNFCHYCHRPDSSLRLAKDTEQAVAVVITGPGSVGSKLEDEYRQAILPLVSGNNCDANRLAKKLPRLPFTLAKSVDAASTGQLASDLRALGLEVLVGDDQGKRKSIQQLFRSKDKAMLPRILALLASFSSGIWNGFFSRMNRGNPAMNIILLLALLAGVFVYSLVDMRKAWVRPDNRLPAVNAFRSALAASLRRLNGRMKSPAFQGLAHSIGLKLEVLSDPANLQLVDKADRPVFIRLTEDWVELCLAGQELEQYLRRRSEADIRQELQQLGKLASSAGAGGDAADTSIQQTASLQAELARRHDTEHKLDRLFDRLLDYNNRLERLCLGLTSARLSDAADVEANLKKSILDATNLLTAARSVKLQEEP